MTRNALSFFKAYGTAAFTKRVWNELFRRGNAKETDKTPSVRLSSPMQLFRTSKKVNHEPWNVSFSERLKLINCSGPKRKVVYIYKEVDVTTFRYRAFNMCQALNYSASWVGSYFFEGELSSLSDYLDRIDLVVFVRTIWSHPMDTFCQAAKKRKIPVLFDLDDLVCDITAVPLIMNTLNLNLDQRSHDWFSWVARWWFMASLCDATIGTNEYLCGKLRHIFQKPSYMVNNFLNNEQIQASERLFHKKKARERKGGLSIGYFSGTPSHTNDFAKVAPEIGSLLHEHPDITLDVVGHMEFPNFLNDLIQAGRILPHPLVDFLTLQEKIARDHVNIVPLIDNEFTNCKSELKFFEAAIVGTITCATPTYAYRNSIQDKQTGFLCEEGQWYSTLEAIYRNDVAHDMGSRARDYCLEKYTPQIQVSRIEEVLDTVLANNSK